MLKKFSFWLCLFSISYAWSQKPEARLKMGHTSGVIAVAFSPDGKYVVTHGRETAKLWDRFGHELQTYDLHTNEVSTGDGNTVAFSPDGRHILASTEYGAKLLDLSGNVLATFAGRYGEFLKSAVFSPDGQTVLTASQFPYITPPNTDAVSIWDRSGQELEKFYLPSGLYHAVFSPDGKSILTTNPTNFTGFTLRDLHGVEYQEVGRESNGSFRAIFSPDGKHILSANYDSTATLWDTNGLKLSTFGNHRSYLTAIAFSLDGQYLLTGAMDSTVNLWSLGGELLQTYKCRTWITDLAFAPDGDHILIGDAGAAVLRNLKGDILQTFAGNGRAVHSIDFSPDGKKIVLGSEDRTAKLWDLTDLQYQTFQGHDVSVMSVKFSPDIQYILTGSWDGTAKLWGLNGQELLSVKPVEYTHVPIGLVAFCTDGKCFLTCTYGGGEVELWDLSGQRIFRDHFPIKYYGGTVFAPDGRLILTDREAITSVAIREWEIDTLTLIDIQSGIKSFTSFALSPDGKYIAASVIDTLELWEIPGYSQKKLPFEYGSVNSIAFSPDGKHLLIASDQNVAVLWDLNGKEVQKFVGHTDGVACAVFSPDGKYVLTGSYDNTAKLWDVKTSKNILTFIGFKEPLDSWMVMDHEQYYMGPKKAIDNLYFKIGFQAYGVEQFDLRLNRPDKILENLLPFGADTALVSHYRQAYHKRLEKYGFTEDMLSDDYHVPECVISNSDQLALSTTKDTVQLQIEALDSLRLLDRLNVFVNDVPIYGIQGIDLREQNTQAYSTSLDIPLTRGSNKIQVSALNQGGAESLKATTYVTYDAPEQKPDLYLITIGVSDYQAIGKDLQYAAKDARDIAALYENASGFQKVHTKVLTDAQVTKSNILALRNWLEQSRVDDQVLIYVSGHGLLDDNYDFYYATHDIDFADPSGKGILYDEIEGLLDGIPARKKLLLMDACHSGEYDKEAPPLTAAQQDSLSRKGISFKGFSKGEGEGAPVLGLQNSFEMMQQLFADLRRGSGATVISSSAGVQVSYEDAEWQNGAFTYAFLYGLRSMKADANQDGQVTASEIQAFVGEFVPRLTEGLQVPTFRRENLEYDFRVW